MADTIFALSSGAPPAAIAVVRISGPHAADALIRLAGRLPVPRRATATRLCDEGGALLDRALVLWLPGPGTATGEDCVELHLHGGRAVIAAVEATLQTLSGLRRAAPGEFTRRAFANGKIDLAEAEGLADLLSAETESQRRAALLMAGGVVSRKVEAWREAILLESAKVEALLDFGDEDDVDSTTCSTWNIVELTKDMRTWLDRPRMEALKEGFRVVLAGPPNAGKSTLFNALVEAEAAITSPLAGTTRDVISRSVAIDGVPFLLLDTAGLRDDARDPIEQIGVSRAHAEVLNADLVLWLGDSAECPLGAWDIAAQTDRSPCPTKPSPRHRVSAVTGAGLVELRRDLVDRARLALPRPGDAALTRRQHCLLANACEALEMASAQTDLLLVAEGLRSARAAFDSLLGRTTTEHMLDALFGRFCIGK